MMIIIVIVVAFFRVQKLFETCQDKPFLLPYTKDFLPSLLLPRELLKIPTTSCCIGSLLLH